MMNRQPSAHPRATASARPVRPPHERGTWKAFAIAALMHVLLGILLYHGVNWQNNTPAGAEAELWTDIPDVTPPPRVVTPPPAPVKVQPAPPPARDEEANIALQEKKHKQQEAAARDAQLAEQQRAMQQAQQEAEAKRQQQAAQQAAALAAQKAAQDKQKQADKQKQLAQQKLDQQKADQAKEKEKEADAAKAAQQAKLDDTKAKEQADAKAKAQADAKVKAKAQADAKAKLDKERNARLAQLQGMAGGGTSSSGEGLAKSGTGTGAGGTAASAGYAEKVQRRVRPNIVWAGETAGLETVVAVRCSPTGTLLSATIRKSSGNDQWDEAALRAVQRSDPMPVDTNGQAPSTFTITLRPAGA